MLSKAHTKAIAKIIKKPSFKSKRIKSLDEYELAAVYEERIAKWLAEDLADYFAMQNLGFDKAQFLKDCGVG